MIRVFNGISTGQSYDGSKQMGDLDNMLLFESDANKILDSSYGLLSQRSTTLYHTYGAVKSAINKQVEYGIGDGLVFRSQPDWSTLGLTKDYARDWGKEFQKIVHYYQQKFNFYEKQSVLFRGALYAGDSPLFFLRENGLLADLIEAPNSQIDWEYKDENYTLGIKHDGWYRRQGIIKTDGTEISFLDANGDRNLLQFYIKELPRQLRGYPLAYSIINIARNDDTFTDAMTHRAVMEATIMAITKTDGTNFNRQAEGLANRNKANKNPISNALGAVKTAVTRLGAGNVVNLKNTENMEFLDMKAPGNNYDPFKKWGLNYVAMATGTPPEVILSRYESSFTAHKGALNDFVKSYKKKRATFQRTVMNPVILEIAKDAIQQGYISAPGFFQGGEMIQQAYLQGMYLAPVPGHINPLVEVKAEAEAVKEGFQLRSDVSAKYGNEWDNFFPEWEQEQRAYTSVPLEYEAEQVFNRESNNG